LIDPRGVSICSDHGDPLLDLPEKSDLEGKKKRTEAWNLSGNNVPKNHDLLSADPARLQRDQARDDLIHELSRTGDARDINLEGRKQKETPKVKKSPEEKRLKRKQYAERQKLRKLEAMDPAKAQFDLVKIQKSIGKALDADGAFVYNVCAFGTDLFTPAHYNERVVQFEFGDKKFVAKRLGVHPGFKQGDDRSLVDICRWEKTVGGIPALPIAALDGNIEGKLIGWCENALVQEQGVVGTHGEHRMNTKEGMCMCPVMRIKSPTYVFAVQQSGSGSGSNVVNFVMRFTTDLVNWIVKSGAKN